MQPVIVITHAAFDEARRLALRELLSQLRVEAPDLPVLVAHDEERKGSLWCWRVAVGKGLAVDATHVVWLPDDAIVCRDFGAILRACIAARPDDVFDCFVNHPALRRGEVPTCWYSTTDGYTGMGGVMPAKLLREHLEWRAARPELGDYPNDAGLNLWAADTGRLIYKTAWSLVQHNDELPSLDGHDDQAAQGHERRGLRWVDDARGASKFDVGNFLGRTFAAPEAHMPGFRTSCTDLGRTYAGNVFDLVRRIRPERWNVDAMYSACEPPPKDCPRVVILVPTYHEDVEIGKRCDPSRQRVAADLEAHGYEVIIETPPSDSHVDRMRQRATHHALKMGATHVLWWDYDIECLTPSCVRKMLESGHDVIAGACPVRAPGGRVVANLLPETERVLSGGPGTLDVRGGCLEVADVGTGFLLVSRKALVRLMQTCPELCYLSRGEGDRGEPLWALWDASIVGRETDDWAESLRSRSFDTEDYYFCRLWQNAGGRVHCFVPARFRHWGLHGFEGSFEEYHGMRRAQ